MSHHRLSALLQNRLSAGGRIEGHNLEGQGIYDVLDSGGTCSYTGTPTGGTPLVGTPQSCTPLSGTPVTPRRPPRPSTPSTAPVSPSHSPYPPQQKILSGEGSQGSNQGSAAGSRRSSVAFPDSRRGSLKNKASGVVKDLRKSVRSVTDTTIKAGQKAMDSTVNASSQVKAATVATGKRVKDKTVSVGSHVKDATVGASQWVANTTSKTAKAALDQAKSGLSIGEKVTLFAVEKISAWSRKGFTQSFMLVVLILYTALGALLFIAIEEPHETKEKLDIEHEKVTFLQRVWEESRTLSSFSQFNETGHSLLKVYEDQLYKSYTHGVTADDNKVWTFWKAMFFCSTISTTIGYGHIAPSTNAGRALTIVYAIVGIPLFLILLADFGKLFTRILKSIFVFLRRLYRTATCRRVRKKKPVQSCLRRVRSFFSWMFHKDREADAGDNANGAAAGAAEDENFTVDDNFNLPVSLALIILLIYILFGCIFYTSWEDWTYFEAFYFIFISMTTIGFGDYVPKHPAYMMATTIYLLFGLALTAMSINIIQEKLSDTFRTATKKLKESFAYIMAATQGEEGVDGGEVPEGVKAKEVEVAEVHGNQDKKES